ncbi:MAG: hypothetical protein NC123_18945 [Butyrivibrio sp.]|nr:hypothetical protein [Acetatifactor muris]MCM1561590.1 hypothetical protein [Butyrivibrio sp.]
MQEDKKEIVTRLKLLLTATRAGADIDKMELTEEQHFIVIQWKNGCTQRVNIEADSGIAIIGDVLRAIS